MENVLQSLKFGTNSLLDFTGAAQDFPFSVLIFDALFWSHMVDLNIADGDHLSYIIAKVCLMTSVLCCVFNSASLFTVLLILNNTSFHQSPREFVPIGFVYLSMLVHL